MKIQEMKGAGEGGEVGMLRDRRVPFIGEMGETQVQSSQVPEFRISIKVINFRSFKLSESQRFRNKTIPFVFVDGS